MAESDQELPPSAKATKSASASLPQITFLEYEETLLYGQHSRRLSSYALSQAALPGSRLSRRRVEKRQETSRTQQQIANCSRRWKTIRKTSWGRTFEDWIFLTLLGVSVAVFSFVIDLIINKCHTGRMRMLDAARFSIIVQFVIWVGFYIVFACFAVGITHLISPMAIGSGIPEMKTMIRGVVMPEYLTIRTLVAKVVGLTASLGSGLPIGKEGPFVHIAGISAAIIEKFLAALRDSAENHETNRMADILAPACAVGVACTFAAPVGGLLFSIEATATYFAVRNYWRGFYAAACGTIAFRLLAIWFHEEETLTALERTYLPQEVPFHPIEMIIFAVLGLLCGFGGAIFISINKSTVLFLRGQKKVKEFLQRNRFIYPTLIAFVVGACMFPPGLGQYSAGQMTNVEALKELFGNFTWINAEPETLEEEHILHNWSGPLNSVLLTTALFFVMRLWICAISTTCPFPCGMIVPAFTIGAGFGRFYGELLALLFPLGVGGNLIIPGGYALVGSAAFAGSVTQAFSTVVIIFELTGQIGHVLPCIIAVVIANVVSRSLGPSVYDAIMQIKKLPYLPASIDADTLNAHQVFANDIMRKNVFHLSNSSTYGDAQRALADSCFKVFPVVNNEDDMVLIGTVQRSELDRAVNEHLSLENYQLYTKQRRHSYYKRSRTKSTPQITTVLENICTPPESSFSMSPQRALLPLLDGAARSSSVDNARNGDMNTLREGGGGPRRESLPVDATEDRGTCQLNPKSESLRFSVRPVITRSDDIAQLDDKQAQSVPSPRKDRVFFQRSSTVDLHDPDEEEDWERFELAKKINLSELQMDEAPFQIVPRTSLYKVHSWFSLLNLQRAFVIDAGRLVGMISLSELRAAIQCEVVSLSSSVAVSNHCDSCSSCCFASKRQTTNNMEGQGHVLLNKRDNRTNKFEQSKSENRKLA